MHKKFVVSITIWLMCLAYEQRWEKEKRDAAKEGLDAFTQISYKLIWYKNLCLSGDFHDYFEFS
jgi:hypothetical protein